MRPVVIRLLLVLLTLQFLWAGAALACQHEQGPAAMHFGHHGTAKSGADSTGDGKVPPSGGECSLCHLTSPLPVLGETVLAWTTREHAPDLGPLLRPALLRPDIPDRPNWHSPS